MRVRIQILYDNSGSTNPNAFVSGKDGWGFSALVSYRGQTVLFDTGGNSDQLLAHMRALRVDPAAIDAAVISHPHWDHIGGLPAVHQANPRIRVYCLADFPQVIFDEARALGLAVERVRQPRCITPGIFTSGAISGHPPEQALIIERDRDLVILTGCAHPGVVRMVRRARSLHDDKPVRLLLGGFHLLDEQPPQILARIGQLKAMQVRQIAPAHCTGSTATHLFSRAFGKNYLTAGVGRLLSVTADR